MAVLAIIDWYLPGTRGGGPARSLAALVETLNPAVSFYLVTRDHDIGDRTPYVGVNLRSWNAVGRAQVHYLSIRRSIAIQLARLSRSSAFDVVYLNSIFSPLARSYLLIRRLRLVPERPLIVAPRGELGELALALKGKRKRTYLRIAKMLRLYEGVVWAASSSFERDDIHAAFGKTGKPGDRLDVRIVPNVVNPVGEYVAPRTPKQVGAVRLVFLSRIDRKKNLDGALNLLQSVRGQVTFDIYGPTGDPGYLAECRNLAETLPASVQVRFMGELAASAVSQTMREYDLFVLPTLNENFGHVIIEALSAGCPVLISDQTAWRGLQQRGAGWDISLNKPELFVEVLEQVVKMDASQSDRLRRGAWRYAAHVIDKQQAVAKNRELFEQFSSSRKLGQREGA